MSHQIIRKLNSEVENKYIKKVKKDKLSLYKYTNRCVYDKAWNEITLMARGIIFDYFKGTVICRPFNKFFNLNEVGSTQTKILETKLDDGFICTEKMDGTLINIWFYENSWHCSTSGSFDSWQAKYVEANLLPKLNLKALPENLTLCCEFISPKDRELKVIQYEQEKLVAITAFENKVEQVEVPWQRFQMICSNIGIETVTVWHIDKNNLFSYRIPENKEGYCIRFNNGTRVKIKSFHYLKAAKAVSLIDVPHIIEFLKDGKIEEIVDNIPNEKKNSFDDFYALIMGEKSNIEKELDFVWNQIDNKTNRKKCAKLFCQYPDLKAILFLRLDEKSEKDLIWKAIENRIVKNCQSDKKC